MGNQEYYEKKLEGIRGKERGQVINTLIRLKDTGGLKYIEIIEIPPFDNLKLPSLGKLYRDAIVRMQNKRIDGNKGMNEKK